MSEHYEGTQKIINLTQHDINILLAGTDKFYCIPPSGIVSRCATEYTTVSQLRTEGVIDGYEHEQTFNVRERYFNEPTDLPAPQDGVLYIVSRIVAEACANVRSDLLMVDGTIKEGREIIGCEAFARWPVTTQEEQEQVVTTVWSRQPVTQQDELPRLRKREATFDAFIDSLDPQNEYDWELIERIDKLHEEQEEQDEQEENKEE